MSKPFQYPLKRSLGSPTTNLLPSGPEEVTDEFIRTLYETSRRYNVVYEVLGIDEISRRIASVLKPWYPEPVSTTVLLNETMLPRSTLLRRLSASVSAGNILRIERYNSTHYVSTTETDRLGYEIAREAYAIVRGWRQGYSPELLEKAKDFGLEIRPEAKTLSFKPLR